MRRIIPDVSWVPCVTSGTQKWNGASPSFMASAMVIIYDVTGLSEFIIVHCPE